MPRWRIACHALDRTGPPMLARSFVTWLAANRPDLDVDVVAFRGGALEAELGDIVPVRIALRPHEPWDHARPDPTRVAELRDAWSDLEPADLVLLVSVSAGQVLDALPGDAPVVAWVVEQGEDLHWIDGDSAIRSTIDVWIAGSLGTRQELRSMIGPDADILVAPEFVDRPDPEGRELVASDGGLDASPGLLVVGCGIGTHRKAPDLFVEFAVALTRRCGVDARFVWIGGESDPLIPLVRREAERLGLDRLSLIDSTPDHARWLAAADVFVHPARLDAFPLVCVEAAALGTPVIAFSGVGGVPEMLGDTFAGEAYPDVGGLARLVAELARAGALADLGSRQQRRVLDAFVTDVAAPRLAEHLDSVIAARGPVEVDRGRTGS